MDFEKVIRKDSFPLPSEYSAYPYRQLLLNHPLLTYLVELIMPLILLENQASSRLILACIQSIYH
jgi:hypothetical protein